MVPKSRPVLAMASVSHPHPFLLASHWLTFSSIVMGDIPAKTNMVSTIITSPGPGQDLTEKQTFDVTLQVSNLEAGSFTNPDVTYYGAPQTLKGGNIVGHTHITIQSLGGSLTPNVAPDPTIFAFFKGVNDAGDGKGGLKATVAGGLPAGNYRVCTMSSASNHQPVLMPVAQYVVLTLLDCLIFSGVLRLINMIDAVPKTTATSSPSVALLALTAPPLLLPHLLPAVPTTARVAAVVDADLARVARVLGRFPSRALLTAR